MMNSGKTPTSLPQSRSKSTSSKSQNPRPKTTFADSKGIQQVGGKNQTKESKLRSVSSQSSTRLKAKEEEYRKLNATLEAKTASLVKEAEELMKEHSSTLEEVIQNEDQPHSTSLEDSNIVVSPLAVLNRPHTARSPLVSEKEDNNNRPTTVGNKGSLKTKTKQTNCTDLPPPISSVEAISADIEKTVRQLERKLEEEELQETRQGGGATRGRQDVIPEVTEDLGTEAMIRFLKAKVRVMQEELDQLSEDNRQKDKELSVSETQLKKLSDQNTKLEKSQQSLQSQIVKYQQLAKDAQQKCESLEVQLISLRRELDNEKSSQKKVVSTHSATEVRLNRALEEVEKYKGLYTKMKADSKDVTKLEKQKMESLEAENKLLERQKNELITAFKKQMKLIDVLKRQKIHLEAARMLAFTEEEFIKALDWESS